MKKYALLLFFLSFFLYNINLNITGSGDNTPARLLPFNILSGKGIFLDDYLPFLPENPPYLQEFNNHLISAYPLLPGVLATPFYLPFYLIMQWLNLAGLENYYWISYVAEKLTASLLSSLSIVAFFFLFNAIYSNKKISFIFTLIFAFATQTFSISSQHLWQHTFSNLFLILSLYLFVRKKFTLSLLVAILCLFSRNIFIIYLPILLTMIILADQKYWRRYSIITLGGIIIFGTLNYYLYGMPIGTEAVSWKYFDPSRFLSNLAVLFFSPARGLLFYTPFFFFGFAAILLWPSLTWLWKKMSKVLFLNLIFLYAILFVYSVYALVDDGWVWGDRYLTDGAVPAVILSYYLISHLKNRLLTILFIITIIYSVFTQVIGTFYYPKGRWDSHPVNITYAPERLWDFYDNPLIRNLTAGPNLRGYYLIYNSLIPSQDGDQYQPCSPEELIRQDRIDPPKIRLSTLVQFECHLR
ncbi:MAG: hypothetical protein Q8P92_00710 [Candidatus Daviesbacteria bacterium]|nr:hypothetical protein [Candidatus Daviesbacteria bacterium]